MQLSHRKYAISESWLHRLVMALPLAFAAASCTGPAGPGGEPCTVTHDATAGTRTIVCAGGTTAVIADGVSGTGGTNGTGGTSCTVAPNEDGTKTISCSDGTSVVVADGQDLIDVTHIPSNAVPATDASSAAWQAFEPYVTVSSVAIAGGPPVVEFTGSTQQKRAEQAIGDGRAVGNCSDYIHKIHMGKGGRVRLQGATQAGRQLQR